MKHELAKSHSQLFFFFSDIKKFSLGLGSQHFPTFSEKKKSFEQKDGHGNLRNGHGKDICKVYGNPV